MTSLLFVVTGCVRHVLETSYYTKLEQGMFEGLPSATSLISDSESDSNQAIRFTEEYLSYQLNSTDAETFTEYFTITVPQSLEKRYFAANASVTNKLPIKKGDVLFLYYQMRASDSTGIGRVSMKVAPSANPKVSLLRSELKVQHGWTQYSFRMIAQEDYAPGALRLDFLLGRKKQRVDFGGLVWFNFGDQIALEDLPSYGMVLDYEGRDPDAPWRIAAEERIEKYRKGNLNVLVIDAEGNAVEGAQVDIKMTRHAFLWGGAFKAKDLVEDERYRSFLKSGVFNGVVLENDLKWSRWENPEGLPRRATTIKAIDWLVDEGFWVKGHCLTWGIRKAPRYVKKLKDQPEKVKEAMLDSIIERCGLFAGKISAWDVVNEHHGYSGLDEILGPDNIVEQFKLAKVASGGARLIWNETAVIPGNNPSNPKFKHIEEKVSYLLENEAPIDSIGLQSHFYTTQAITPPEDLYALYERFAMLGVDIEITEFDFNLENKQDGDNVKVHADYVRDFMITSFSHPKVKSFITWTPVESRWMPSSSLVDKNFEYRPHGEVYRDLITEVWWTNEQVQTNIDGHCEIRGFLGDYLITVKRGSIGKSLTTTIKPGSNKVVVTLD